MLVNRRGCPVPHRSTSQALAAFLFVLSAASAASPPTNQHGTRVGQAQTTYLVEPQGISARDLTPERLRTLLQVAEGQIAVSADGRTVLLPRADAPTPGATFETWVEQLPIDYQESVTAG